VLHFSTDVQEAPLQNGSSLLTELNAFCTETAYMKTASPHTVIFPEHQ